MGLESNETVFSSDSPTTEDYFIDEGSSTNCASNSTSQFNCVQPVSLTQYDLKHSSAEFLLNLREGCHLSQVAIKSVMNGCRQLCMQTALKVARSLSDELSDAGIESTRFQSFRSLSNQFLILSMD